MRSRLVVEKKRSVVNERSNRSNQQLLTAATVNRRVVGSSPATWPALVPEIQNPPDHGAAIWVFELP
jgi:hypothetical protein